MDKSRKWALIFLHDGGGSQKEFKVMCNKKFLRLSRQRIKLDRETPVNLNEVMCARKVNGMGKPY